MKCRFWGVRGSIPAPMPTNEIQQKAKEILMGAGGIDLSDESAVDDYIESLPLSMTGSIGGNTACVELRVGGELMVFDAGSGLRLLGLQLMKEEFSSGKGTVNIFNTHTHWDHILGFPFFIPAYVPGNKIIFHSACKDIEERIRAQQDPRFFPVSLDEMRADFDFRVMVPVTPTEVGCATVTAFALNHPGGAHGYRVEHDGRVFVYATDTEFFDTDTEHTRHLRDADVLVLDTMYTFEDVITKAHWGHCTPMIGVDLALRGNVRKLALFHHEPTYSDAKLVELLEKTIEYKEFMDPESDLEIVLSREGMEIIIS